MSLFYALFNLRNLLYLIQRLYEKTKVFRQAVKLAPQRVKEVFTEIFAKDRETRELQRILRRSVKKRNEYER